MQTCTQCGENKESEAFGFRNKASERRHRKCKTCVAAYGKLHYTANRTTYVARNNRRSRSQTLVLKEKVWEHLLAHPCSDCGIADPVALEFDHDDPAAKLKTIYKLIHQAYSWEAVAAEIAKCHVRCANCHRRRTAAQFAWPKGAFDADNSADLPRGKAQPQRLVLRRPIPLRTPKPIAEVLTREMKLAGFRVCPWCGRAKTAHEFHWRDEKAGERQTVCGGCFTAYRREHYRLNREAYIARNRRLLRQRGQRWSRRLWAYLVAHACVDCGEADPILLEFDHKDPSTKRAVVGSLARGGYPWATVEAELNKCEIRCANCHRRRTAVQFDWPKLRINVIRL